VVQLEDVRRIAIWMHLGAVFGLLCAILGPDPEPGDHGAFAAIIAVELVALALLAALRPTIGFLRAVGVYSVVITCVCVAVARPLNGVPLYTIWPVVLGAYAMSRRDFAAVLAMTVAGLAVAIATFVEPPARLNLWVGTTLAVGFAGLVVRSLRERLDELVDELRDVARRLHATARRDPLTGLPNRRAFDEALARELARAARTGRPLSLVLLDLDHFKQVNDRYGHAQGDASLRLFADVVREELRPGDLAGRMGGEEVALVLAGAGAEHARLVAERIAARVRAASAADVAPLTVSGGVAELSPALPTPDALLKAADHALYAAKDAGRRRVAVAGEPVVVGTEVPAAAAGPGEDEATRRAHAPFDEELEVDLTRRFRHDDRPLRRRVALYQCLGGIPAMAASLLLPDLTTWDVVAILGLCVLLAGQAALIAVVRLPGWFFRASPFAGVLTISAAVALNDPISGTPFFFVWPLLYSAYFFDRRRHLLPLVATMGASYGVALALWVEAPLRISDWTTVMAPIVITALAVSVLRARVQVLVGQLHGKLGELQAAASHDPLTGVLNRRAFDGVLAREVERAGRDGLDLSLVIFDVDHFKQVNDRLGHAAGDDALRVVADTLGAQRRAGDVVGRLGGEEFGVLLPGTGAVAAGEVADAIAARLAELTAGEPLPLTVSAGVAQLGDEVATTDHLLVSADRALYAAKSAGRSRTVVHTAPSVLAFG
jgi:diguanylate cyclase (GGDEF)-like protein